MAAGARGKESGALPSVFSTTDAHVFFFPSSRAPSLNAQAVTSLSPFRDFALTNKFGNAIDVGDLGVR